MSSGPAKSTAVSAPATCLRLLGVLLLLAQTASARPGPAMGRSNATRALRAGPSDAVCRNDEGEAVDWYVALKMPNGYDYAYVDSSNVDKGFKKAPNTLDKATGNFFAETVKPLYDRISLRDVGYAMYNDQDPDGKSASSSRGHTKGVIGMDTDGGFWLVHSVPRFPKGPSETSSYEGYPDYASRYGQSFLCLSLGHRQLNEVARQLYYNYPAVFEHNLPESLAGKVPNLKDFLDGKHVSSADSRAVDLSTDRGKTFTSFAKTSKFDDFLFESFVAPHYNSGFLVETWMNGRNPDETFCPGREYKYASINVRKVAIGSTTWKETQDHSKWAVSVKWAPKKVACVGDINRQQSQNHRAGGTVCVEDSKLWKAFSDAVAEADDCGERQ